MSRDQIERGCRGVCIALLYIVGMLLIIAGIAAGVFTQSYPDLLLYLAIASASAILMGILFVAMSAAVCTRRRPPPRTSSKTFISPPLNAGPVKNGGSRRPSDSTAAATGKVSTPNDSVLGSALEKGEYYSTGSVEALSLKKSQKPVTSSPRVPAAKGPQSFAVSIQQSPSLPAIPPAGQGADGLRKSRPRSSKANAKPATVNGPSSISDFLSLELSADDVVSESAPVGKGTPKSGVKGRGRVPLTVFKQASKSVSDLDDEMSFECDSKPAHRNASPRPSQRIDPRLAVSCHNILSEEPVRVGIAHLRQRDEKVKSDTHTAKPPVPRKITGVALPGLAQGPWTKPTSRSQDDLRRRREGPQNARHNPTEFPRPTRDISTEQDINFLPRSVPYHLDSGGGVFVFPESSMQATTAVSRSENRPDNPAPSYERLRKQGDIERCNMIGLPPPSSAPQRPLNVETLRVVSMNPGLLQDSSVPTRTTVHQACGDSRPLVPEWTPSLSSKTDTLSSEDSHGLLHTSQDMLLEDGKCLMETEI